MPEALNNLTDIEVESVGLVPQGAVSIETDEEGKPTGTNFFLMKAKEGTVPDELVIEEVETEVPVEETQPTEEQPTASETQPENEDATLFERFKNFLNRAEPVEAEQDEGKQEIDLPEGNEVMAKSQTQEPTAAEVILKAQMEMIQKQNEAHLEAILKATEEKYETRLTDLQQRVEKAENEAKEADEQRQKREYVEKAIQLRALPVKTTELADKLFALNKAAPKEAEWLEGLLKATDNQLGAAGIFAEMGTNRTPEEVEIEDKVEKAIKDGVDPADALLGLSEADQLALLKDIRGGK